MSFSQSFPRELDIIESYLREQLGTPPIPALAPLWESLKYSLFSGGKRFRPLLSLLTATALGREVADVLPLAAAVELIHTYSLVHDDLPCMDNDDLRRGRPTSHKVYGEAGALLAGDALLTQAFAALARSESPNLGRVLSMLSAAAGASGMVGGQVLDVACTAPDTELLHEIHRRKTGALIASSVSGAAILAGASEKLTSELSAYGEALGFAFQLADDIQDHNPDKLEKVSFTTRLGLEETKSELQKASDRALRHLKAIPKADGLRLMVELNLERV